MRKIEIPSVPEFERGTQQQIFSKGGRRGSQEKGKRHKNRWRRRPRGRTKGQGQRKVTLRQRLEDRWEHHSSGAHDQHLPVNSDKEAVLDFV